jgi:hypothetical protein
MWHSVLSYLSRLPALILATGLVAALTAATVNTAVAGLVSRRWPTFCSKAVLWATASTWRVTCSVAAIAILPIVLRLAFLGWVPQPQPTLADEFGHLLVADTLVAGRLANPVHPLHHHLETTYILQTPAYASIYPLGQGAILAAGQVLFHNPWAGVLLSAALMSGAIGWALLGCLPRPWALLGGLIAAVQYGLAPAWVNTYWGGSFCAFGGALLWGALCRLPKGPSRALATMVGVGWSIVWCTRPFESLLPLLLAWAVIAFLAMRSPLPRRKWLATALVVFSIQASAGCLTMLHNNSVTHSFFRLPYQLSQSAYGVPQSLLWQKPVAEPQGLPFPELKRVYAWQREIKEQVTSSPVRYLGSLLYTAWGFYVTPWYSLPLILLAFRRKDNSVALAAALLAAALAIDLAYPFFFAHYAAAYTCVIVFLIVKGVIALSHWSGWGAKVGPAVAIFLVSGAMASGLRYFPVKAMLGLERNPYEEQVNSRFQVVSQFLRLGGRHVAFVRYGATHSIHNEWVYNAANVDAAPIVWCRAIDRVSDEEVARYYKGRQFWLVSVDDSTTNISRYRFDDPTASPAGGDATPVPGLKAKDGQ